MKTCLNCEKRHYDCHDGCPEYQAEKEKKEIKKLFEVEAYLIDKHYRLKKRYGGRRR